MYAAIESSRSACSQADSWRLHAHIAQTVAIAQMTIIRRMLPTIVAHRGDAEHFPENSLAAFEAAWSGGLSHVELDVQVSADGVPYVLHDATLDRTTRATGDLRLMNSLELDGIDAGEPARFRDRHAGMPLPRLSAAIALMHVLNQAANALVTLPASPEHPGIHAGMTFTMLRGVEPFTSAAERMLIVERLRQLATGARHAGRRVPDIAALGEQLETVAGQFSKRR